MLFIGIIKPRVPYIVLAQMQSELVLVDLHQCAKITVTDGWGLVDIGDGPFEDQRVIFCDVGGEGAPFVVSACLGHDTLLTLASA